jgi:glycosyltransferase involved in cell wall biosynthesis
VHPDRRKFDHLTQVTVRSWIAPSQPWIRNDPLMRAGEPILIVSHTFPPFRGIGGRRWAKLAKELARRGHPVHVVHADQGRELKGSFWETDAMHPLIHRYALRMRYPQVLMKRPLTSVAEKLAYRYWSKVLPCMTKGNPFDRSVRWAPVLLPACEKLIAQHSIRRVIATGPPFALLHQLLPLKKRYDVRLIADMRDPWTWGEVYGRSSLSTARKVREDELEAEVMAGYDRVTTPSPYVLSHLQKAHPTQADKMLLLEHVIDPDELGDPVKPAPDGMFRMIYAGSIYNASGFASYLTELIGAFRSVEQERPERWRQLVLDLYITGHGVKDLQRMVMAGGQGDRIRFHDPLPGNRLFPIIKRADLVLAYMPPEKRDLVSTKFNEIAYLGTPVLHIGEAGGLSEHINAQGLGASMRVEDVSAQLPFVLKGEQQVQHLGRYHGQDQLLSKVAEKLVNDVLR